MGENVIGVDFGTESARAVVVRLTDGVELAESVMPYPHGVIDAELPGTGPGTGARLGADWALQHPADWLQVLEHTVRDALAASGQRPETVVGIAVDVTACTIVPTTAAGHPLCLDPAFATEPHAWPKLWKHHASQPQANLINERASAAGEPFLADYGGFLSSEWLLPKALQTLQEAPAVFAATERLIEAQDWVTWQLTGIEARSAQAAGFKATFRAEADGYPTPSFLDSVHPGFGSVLGMLSSEVHLAGEKVGELQPEWAERLGLPAGIAVAIGNMDAQVAMVACGVTTPGRMVLVMGTSVCNLLLADDKHEVEGIAGVVRDAVIPGLWAYEAGQAGVGDLFGWFVRTQVPESYAIEAREAGISVFDHLERLAAAIPAGANPVVALDWWNGNRSVLTDAHLSGLFVGMTLATRPEHLYRALLEAVAFGQKVIIDAFEGAGVPVTELVACGGLPHRNALLMQILADVTGRSIGIAATTQSGALGAAIHAAVAAGSTAGGYDTLEEAAAALAGLGRTVEPDPAATAAYSDAYGDYRRLHDFFGRAQADLMHGLRRRAHAATACGQAIPAPTTPTTEQPTE
ncbi:ribulokinase [Microbacterium dauci]|uniref:Ribulokinase n=1 Tax=Microbacterium dauci TaxID=3048008 RepID=A0ABT6ZEF9_9MICO|nr:ribulokinase [Microbacterium sp. LX3-4]MDJ1114548.1 ribulokinase [Microbacterium sp. LX3-4]